MHHPHRTAFDLVSSPRTRHATNAILSPSTLTTIAAVLESPDSASATPLEPLDKLKPRWVHNLGLTLGPPTPLSLPAIRHLLETDRTSTPLSLRGYTDIQRLALAVTHTYRASTETVTPNTLFALNKALTPPTHERDPAGHCDEWRKQDVGRYLHLNTHERVWTTPTPHKQIAPLMNHVLERINTPIPNPTVDACLHIFGDVHQALVRIEPILDTASPFAMLVANICLLRNGFPPLIINPAQHAEYDLLCDELVHDRTAPTIPSQLWPHAEDLKPLATLFHNNSGYARRLLNKPANPSATHERE